MHQLDITGALTADAVPASFQQALNRLLQASGIRPLRSVYRPVAHYPADGGETYQTETLQEVPPRIGRVVVFIEEHLEEPLTVDRLAEEAELSKYYFSRLFRDEMGQPPWAFVREARIQKAKRLLAQGAPPATAAVEAGFFDQSHLTNVMREREGKTPKQYQQEHYPPDRKDLQE